MQIYKKYPYSYNLTIIIKITNKEKRKLMESPR